MILFAEGLDVTSLVGWVVAGFACMAGTVAILFKMLTAKSEEIARDQKLRIADLENKIKSLELIADEGRDTALKVVNWYRQKYEAKPPIVPVAPVLPLVNSPSTERQRTEARIETLRAGLAQINEAVGFEPHPTPEKAVEENTNLTPPVALSPPPPHQAPPVQAGILEALGIKEEIGKIRDQQDTMPEKTAEKVVEKIKENEDEGR